MILIRNNDVPGVIGEVCNILGSNDVNISDFRLARKKDSALAVILVDSAIDNNLLQKLENIEAATSVSYIEI